MTYAKGSRLRLVRRRTTLLAPAVLATVLSAGACSLFPAGLSGSDVEWKVAKTIPIVALDGTTSVSGEPTGARFVIGRMSTHVDYMYAVQEKDGAIVQHLTSEMKGQAYGKGSHDEMNFVTGAPRIYQDATVSTARIDIVWCHPKPGVVGTCADLNQHLRIHVPPGSFTSDFTPSGKPTQ